MPDVSVTSAAAAKEPSKLEQDLARARKRLDDVKAGHAKASAMLADRPKSDRAEGWKRRIAEYEESMEGLPIEIAKLEFTLKQRAKRQS